MRATQPVSINGIEADALIESSQDLESAIPEYPVEKGYSVSDAILLHPEVLNMTLFISDTPVSWSKTHGVSVGRAEQVCNQLKELYYKGDMVTVVTYEATYDNMGIEAITIQKSVEIGYAREVSIKLKKVRITTSKTTTIPDSYGKSGQTQAAAGSTNTKKATTTKKSSTSSTSASSSASGNSSNNSSSSSKSSSEKASEKSSIAYKLFGLDKK